MMKLKMFGTRESGEDSGKQFEDLIEVFMKMDTREKMNDFLEGILTPKERLELPHRLEIIKMLKKGVSQHDIAGKLGVGVATVTRGSREIQRGRFKYV